MLFDNQTQVTFPYDSETVKALISGDTTGKLFVECDHPAFIKEYPYHQAAFENLNALSFSNEPIAFRLLMLNMIDAIKKY